MALTLRARPAFAAESDVELALRAAPAGLKQLEGFYVASGDRSLEPVLAEAYCGYGALLQDRWEDAALDGDADAGWWQAQARSALGRCGAYAERLLPPHLRGLLTADDDDAEQALARARRADAVGLAWLGTAAAASIGVAPGELALVALVPRVALILERVVALSPGHADGQADMTLGILYAAQSAAVGGDPERGARHLDAASAATGGRLLLPAVMRARIHAVTTRDPGAFDAGLRAVLATPPSVYPAQRLANELAHRKAARYLRHRGRWF